MMVALVEKVRTFLICLCVATVVVADLSSEYNHEAYLDPDENYKLYWSVKDADKSIHFATEVKTTGWVGFGISVGLTGSMKDADIVMGWVDSSGKPFLEVRHSSPFASHFLCIALNAYDKTETEFNLVSLYPMT